MADWHIRAAYAQRADEYTRLLGSLEDLHPLDRRCVESWSNEVCGYLLDAGCGPGHWTNFLHQRGVNIEGIDLVPEFIAGAQDRFPEVPFRVASLRDLSVPDGTLGGVLAWYSLIHVPPDELPAILAEFARALAPGGRLLIGYFDGVAAEAFPPVVTTAYCWSAQQLGRLLNESGFAVLAVQTRQDPGRRPHAALSAVLRP
ncbi:class I SAM-dependent methyltransferase [Tomitella biformata]|uniref:class I SAM-dependent methyltransferase n=1 Tax=Tomitella biformata TaxID=630403 RepID=UPI000466B733|nr:class I SAM-dependent methyltransferase [Tomitella biformata]